MEGQLVPQGQPRISKIFSIQTSAHAYTLFKTHPEGFLSVGILLFPNDSIVEKVNISQLVQVGSELF